jgi:hypothetical protein
MEHGAWNMEHVPKNLLHVMCSMFHEMVGFLEYQTAVETSNLVPHQFCDWTFMRRDWRPPASICEAFRAGIAITFLTSVATNHLWKTMLIKNLVYINRIGAGFLRLLRNPAPQLAKSG